MMRKSATRGGLTRKARGQAGTRAAMAATAAVALFALTGCGQIGNPLQALTEKRPAPDEFQVIARQPLQMPAAVTLPEPRPGARSPLDPDPNHDAVVALMGTDTRTAGAGYGAGTSAGEQALLSAADAAASEPEIRTTLAAERDSRGSNEPYEPPTIWELFGGSSSDKPKDAIDAAAEARRLQSQGVAAAPIDPRDVPPAEEEIVVETSPYPPMGVSGAPRNKLPSSGPTPTF
jgi:hypothetical protein